MEVLTIKNQLLLESLKEIITIATFSFSLMVSLFVMPKVITINKLKNITADIGDRNSHTGAVPTLGGIGVFVGLLLTVNIAGFLFGTHTQMANLIIFNITTFSFLMIGIVDDIINISPMNKLGYQVVLAILFCWPSKLLITDFYGFLGLTELSSIVSIIISVFVIVLIINAYNLTDGIDGLAGLLGIIISLFVGVIFYTSNHVFYALISFASVGSLVAFLVYNFSHKRKIFLGDTGTMVVGFVLAFQMLLYLNLSAISDEVVFKNAPVFVAALLAYPLLDTTRIFIVRLKNCKNPFQADRNHIHHRLLDLGLSHKSATLFIGFFSCIITSLAYFINHLSIHLVFLILFVVAIILLSIPFCIKRTKNKIVFSFPTF